MPDFPGMGYPLVPGYESVGGWSMRRASVRAVGETVFVPGARCFGDVRGLFGGAAARVVVSRRVIPIDPRHLGEQGVLIALAATAYHAIADGDALLPDLIVGHGVLGRLLARIATSGWRAAGGLGNQPRAQRALWGYTVITPTPTSAATIARSTMSVDSAGCSTR
jgi:3-hydroxyethyl bacteriochlorophyllide a dehydrogenase